MEKVSEKKTNQISIKLAPFEKFILHLSNWLNWVAIFGFVCMALLTTVDVIGAKLFKSPLLFAYEGSGLLGVFVTAFALALTQMKRGNIDIDFLTSHFPQQTQRILGIIAYFIGAALFAVMTWQMLDYALVIQKANRVTSMQAIPLSPFAYATAFCFFAVFLTCVLQFLQSLFEEMKK